MCVHVCLCSRRVFAAERCAPSSPFARWAGRRRSKWLTRCLTAVSMTTPLLAASHTTRKTPSSPTGITRTETDTTPTSDARENLIHCAVHSCSGRIKKPHTRLSHHWSFDNTIYSLTWMRLFIDGITIKSVVVYDCTGFYEVFLRTFGVHGASGFCNKSEFCTKLKTFPFK